MESNVKDNDVYGLINSLCKNIFRRHYQVEEHPYLPQENNNKHLKKLKSKAYEILLKKSKHDYAKDRIPCDPIVELLKHAYVLKVGVGCFSKAAELEKYLDEFIDNGLDPNSATYATLQFLNELKCIESEDDYSLDIFHYGKANPMLPEMLPDDSKVPSFQIYPVESFHLSKKLKTIIKQEHDSLMKFNATEPESQLPLLGLFAPPPKSNMQEFRYSDGIMMSNIPRYTTNLINGSNLLLNYFVPELKDVNKSDESLVCKEVIVTEPETPLQSQDLLKRFSEKNQTEICEIEECKSKQQLRNLDKIWEEMDKTTPISNHRTWETLGRFNPPKEPSFASESIEATLHLINMAHDSILPKQYVKEQRITEIYKKEFMSNIKLLLLGIESSTFIYNPSLGFELKKNIAIKSLSAGTLENLTYEITHWGTSFRNLSALIVTNKETGKMQMEGLIFKALCISIKEFLLFYHAAILRVCTTMDDNVGLLEFLNKVKPLGNLINKVAKLCGCDTQTLTSLGEGIGILTHIYKEVTKVTEQNVALVFCSILKNCCEVYFRFLQRWIFEGECTDIYEEFMIKVKPQYLRTRGHRFWTRAFSINQKSVPGFLSELADSILQCGKTVALLRICNPQNPLCRVSASSQPPIKVCLSVGLLREQAKFYEDYMLKGDLEHGEEVSLCSAIREEKEVAKKRAELVIEALQHTLVRLKKEQQDAIKKRIKEKSELLEQLKDQAEEVAHRKERDRDAELLADKLLLETILKQEEEAKNIERLEREKSIKYYNELAEEAERRRIHADWRIRRMKLFDERILAIRSLQQEFISTPDESCTVFHVDNNNKEEQKPKEQQAIINQNTEETEKSTQKENSEINTEKQEDFVTSISILDSTKVAEKLSSEDENSNPTTEEISESSFKDKNINVLDTENQNINVPDQKNEQVTVEKTQTKAIRPNVLDIPGTHNIKYSEDFDRLDGFKKVQNTDIHKTALNLLNLTEMDNMTEAQRNKLKVLQHEYGISPNNNFLSTDNFKKKSISAEAEKNRLKNTHHFNWDNLETIGLKLRQDNSNEEKTEIQLNRLKNIQHFDHLNWNQPTTSEILEKRPLTEAQINKNRIMSHFYNRMEEFIHVPQKLENLTDCQRNRNRNMAHCTDQFDFDVNKFDDHEQLKETPMSTTTDPFTISTCSNSIPVQSYENTPISEITNQSDMLFARSSNAASSEDISQSRDSKYFQTTSEFPNFIGFGSVPETPADERLNSITPSAEIQLTTADVEMIDTTSLQVYLEKSVILPLTAQNRLVNKAIIKYLLTEHKMLSHLHSLRSYFFLLNGEFAKTLMQSLFKQLYKIKTTSELFNSSTLTNILEKALISSLSTTYTNSELLSLSATSILTSLQTSNPEILSCLSLNYKISWPLNIIFNDIIMQQYSRVFKFLLMVGRVLWVLQEDFQILKIARKTSTTQNHHKLQLYRHSMMQFMNALHTYLTCSVLHASWSEFEKKLENAMTLDEIYDTHVSYIKKILSRCMLNARGEKMRMCLCNIFKVVLKFHNRVKTQNWSELQSAGPNYDNLERMYVAFCEQRAYLAHVAEKLANTGYQPHLLQFLHALNINHRYDLTSQK